jgi:hypothetical protein
MGVVEPQNDQAGLVRLTVLKYCAKVCVVRGGEIEYTLDGI